MTKGQTSKLEAQKKKKKGAASTQRRQRVLPAGWIQGDFLPSSVTENDVLELVEHGMVANKSWRLPEGEMEQRPKEGGASLLSHVARGFSLPPHAFFQVLNGNPTEEEEGSQEGSADSAEYVSDSGETEEETEEEEEEDGEQSSPPSPPQHRTKRRHDPAALPAPPAAPSAPPAPPVAPSARSVKRTRGASAQPVNQPSKVAKPSGPKPWKALPQMRIAVPVASARASFEGYPSGRRRPKEVGASFALSWGYPSAANPTMSVPPSEAVPPARRWPSRGTGRGELGMPGVFATRSAVQYDARRLPEDQVGAAKDAMVQVELMVGDTRGAYDSIASLYKKSLELRDDIRIRADLPEWYQWGHSECTQV
ncbi:hypothetical protein ZWY2020_001605 [Hordeum vulgare]|nr:hypothetical protein ZWY2020_001605 [Hordeum vulgare]